MQKAWKITEMSKTLSLQRLKVWSLRRVKRQTWMILFHDTFLVLLAMGTDEVVKDEKLRNASRTWRQTFKLPETERLVNCTFLF